MGKVCKYLACIFGGVGLIAAFGLAYKDGQKLKVLKEDYDYTNLFKDIKQETIYERDWLETIIIFSLVLLCVLVVSVGLYTIGIIYDEVVPSLTMSQGGEKQEFVFKPISADDYKVKDEKIIPFGGWKCPECGKVYQGYEKVCSCGYKHE